MNTTQQHSQQPWEGNIQKQLWQLRYEDPTQYQALVKMHLSFATDLPVDECDGRGALKQPANRKWQLTPLIRRLGRATVSTRGVMEGAPLTQEGVCQAFQLIHFLNKEYNISQEGLFRKSGSLTRQQELKNLLNSGGDLNLDSGSHSAHDCASVLKSFLADLPEPLLTEAHYSIHCKIAEMLQDHMCQEQKEVAHNRQIKALRLLFLLLPPENYQLLQDLLILLHRVTAHKEQNLMSATNLGTMFAPHILCPRKMTGSDLQYLSGTLSTAVAFMIENAPHLFQVPLELEYDVLQYWNNKKRLRHQLSKRSLMDAPTNTIFTFIDRELTAQANDKDVTEVALAELYAYVQSLPDSAKKKRLIKKFNHASGIGTPHLNNSTVSRKQEVPGKSLGDSIKKHLFYKTIKSSKSKSTPIASLVATVGVKRTNSEDILSSPSKRSPELRRFHRKTDTNACDQLRTKSLDDITSLMSGYASPVYPSSDQSTCSSIRHPAYNPNSGYRVDGSHFLSGARPTRHNSGSGSNSDSGSCCSLASLPLTPLALNSSTDSQLEGSRRYRGSDMSYSTFDGTLRGESSRMYDFPDSVLEEMKENDIFPGNMMHSTPAGSTTEVRSPISEAMLRSSIPQKVIMTPRSRCPIIINSATNLANTAIPEERDSSSCNTTLELNAKHDSDDVRQNSPVISNPSALLFSPAPQTGPTSSVSSLRRNDYGSYRNSNTNGGKEERDGDDISDSEKNAKPRKLKKSSSLRRTLSSVSSTGSLFGSFFHHLSTSSLGQLATRLTSSTVADSPMEEKEEDSPDTTMCNEPEMNESLSSVFREYLMSRSILTDNPVDLSMQFVDNGAKENGKGRSDPMEDVSDEPIEPHPVNDESNVKSMHRSNSTSSQLCSTPAHGLSADSAVGLSPNASLSDSLLFILDGNIPESPVKADKRNEKERDNELKETFVQDHNMINASCADCRSCTPDSQQQSRIEARQGTPIRPQDKDGTNILGSGRGIVFETSF
ncbi:uncharacterized protein RhoGAP54D [Palaemon carinicauda]|uniref:uncharacterized protein RhoGAP54D n=1 Tax=Palaemon carinicauda TaxID=392227 RepID=UPI0035B61A98